MGVERGTALGKEKEKQGEADLPKTFGVATVSTGKNNGSIVSSTFKPGNPRSKLARCTPEAAPVYVRPQHQTIE